MGLVYLIIFIYICHENRLNVGKYAIHITYMDPMGLENEPFEDVVPIEDVPECHVRFIRVYLLSFLFRHGYAKGKGVTC